LHIPGVECPPVLREPHFHFLEFLAREPLGIQGGTLGIEPGYLERAQFGRVRIDVTCWANRYRHGIPRKPRVGRTECVTMIAPT
jgi:hypothetical protein